MLLAVVHGCWVSDLFTLLLHARSRKKESVFVLAGKLYTSTLTVRAAYTYVWSSVVAYKLANGMTARTTAGSCKVHSSRRN